ncbi:hypothetical protein Ancab_000740 [Ancistrocladus abbreviatus]
MVLTDARQRVSFPQFSPTLPQSKMKNGKPSQVTDGERMSPKMLENHSGAGMDKERVEGGLLSSGAKYGGGFMEMDSWRETDQYAIVARRRGGGEKVVVEDAEIKRFGDIGEEDNAVNRACGMSIPSKKLGYEATNAESLHSATQAQRKRNKKLNFEGRCLYLHVCVLNVGLLRRNYLFLFQSQ